MKVAEAGMVKSKPSAMKCELCGECCESGFEAGGLFELFGLKTPEDDDRYVLCRDCYDKVEREVSLAWLNKVGKGEK